MMTILEQLKEDHDNLNRLLAILSQKVKKLRAGEHPNFGLLADAISYITNFADAYHHPWENEIYKHFEGRDEQLDRAMKYCADQHHEMIHLGAELAESVDCILNDAVIPMDQFTDRLELFVVKQVEHLKLEDEELMPALLRVANTVDWQVLEKALSRPEDPLFGSSEGRRYSELYQQLLSNESF